MSIINDLTTTLTLIKSFRDDIRTKLVSMGIAMNSDNLETCKTKIQAIKDHSNKTSSTNYVTGYNSISTANGAIFTSGTGGGYFGPNTMIRTSVPNLLPENIKTGVNIAGIVGKCTDVPTFIADVKISSNSTYLELFDGSGCAYSAGYLGDTYAEYINPSCPIKGTLVVLHAVTRNDEKLISGTDFIIVPELDGTLYFSAGLITGPNPKIRTYRFRNS